MLIVFDSGVADVDPAARCDELARLARSAGGPSVPLHHGPHHVATYCGSPEAGDCAFSPEGLLVGYVYGDGIPDAQEESQDMLLERCLQLWGSEGTGFLSRVNGSFALFLHAVETGESLVTTDRFATYPLWIVELDSGRTAVSSHFPTLARLAGGNIDPASVWSFLTRARPVGQRSFLEGVRAIRPGTALRFAGGRLDTVVQWYTPRFEPESRRSSRYWGDQLVTCLRAAVRDQMRGCSAPGLLLSGGLDSRLVASVSPSGTRCFTLADYNNREMKTARRAARICGLEHVPILRDEDWYPDMVEYAVTHSIGLWHWHNAHFVPLKNHQGRWDEIDRVMLAMGFDTFLKGNQVQSRDLWGRNAARLEGDAVVSFLLDFGTRPSLRENEIESIMRPEAAARCREAFRDAIREELAHVTRMAGTVPDTWEMMQFRSVHRVPYFTNLTCLREFTHTRNVIFDNRLYDLYFRIPAHIRRSGDVVRSALWCRNRRLGAMLDGNSWLPTFLPSWLHRLSRKGRRRVSAVRSRWYRVTGSGGFRSHGSWPQVGRLWVHHPKLRGLMDELVSDGAYLMEDLFGIEHVRRMWEDHKSGRADHSAAVDSVAGFAHFRRYCL